MKEYPSPKIEHYSQKMIFPVPGAPHQTIFLPVLNDLVVLQQARLRQQKTPSPSVWEEREGNDTPQVHASFATLVEEEVNEDYRPFSAENSDDKADESRIIIEEIKEAAPVAPQQRPDARDIDAFHQGLFNLATQPKPLPRSQCVAELFIFGK